MTANKGILYDVGVQNSELVVCTETIYCFCTHGSYLENFLRLCWRSDLMDDS